MRFVRALLAGLMAAATATACTAVPEPDPSASPSTSVTTSAAPSATASPSPAASVVPSATSKYATEWFNKLGEVSPYAPKWDPSLLVVLDPTDKRTQTCDGRTISATTSRLSLGDKAIIWCKAERRMVVIVGQLGPIESRDKDGRVKTPVLYEVTHNFLIYLSQTGSRDPECMQGGLIRLLKDKGYLTLDGALTLATVNFYPAVPMGHVAEQRVKGSLDPSSC